MILKTWKRRICYVALYEFFAIIFSSLILAYFTNSQPIDSTPIAISISIIATTWNYIYNTVFEYWESFQKIKGRSLLRRSAQAVGYELGLICFIIPIYMWWYNINFIDALRMEAGILVFFLIYSFSFSWSFDRIFGLPDSASNGEC